MTQEDKQLLLKDLLPRQLYGVKAHYQYYDFVGGSERLIEEDDDIIDSIDLSLGNPIYIGGHHVELENIKPYLRPLSSMTEEEKYTYRHMLGATLNSEGVSIMFVYVEDFSTVIDWLNEHHFDYRDLIEKGLALEAPKDMYKTE